jgi:hypothetical protein
MNVAMPMIRIGAATPAIFPVAVSPAVRSIRPLAAEASAPATTKIKSATTTFGR